MGVNKTKILVATKHFFLNLGLVKRSFEKLTQFKIIDPYKGIMQRFNHVIVFLL